MKEKFSNADSKPLIVVTGPESTGKSTLTQRLGKLFGIPTVPEFARTYLEERNGIYTKGDLETMAEGQLRSVQSASTGFEGVVLSDTFLLNIVIWSEVRFGDVSDRINSLYKTYPPGFYLLCRPDIPWQPDPLRDNSSRREELFLEFRDRIISSGIPFHELEGDGASRLYSAELSIKWFLENPLPSR